MYARKMHEPVPSPYLISGAGGAPKSEGDGPLPPSMWNDEHPSSPQYLATVALRELLAILHDASLSAYHHRLIAALVYIFSALGDQCAPLLPRVMPTLFSILLQDSQQQQQRPGGGGATLNNAPHLGGRGGKQMADSLWTPILSSTRSVPPPVFNHLMQQFPAMVSAMHAHLQPWMPQLVQVVLMHWHGSLLLQVPGLYTAALSSYSKPCSSRCSNTIVDSTPLPLFWQVLQILEQMTTLLRHALMAHAPVLIPKLSAVIDSDHSSQLVPSLSAIAGEHRAC